MASAVDTQKIASQVFIKSYDHDPGATSAVITSADGGTTLAYVDMANYGAFGALAKPNVVGGSGLTKLEIVASTAATFSSVVVVRDTTVAGDALADNVWLECTADELNSLGTANLRYVAARLTMATSTDEATVTYVGWNPRYPREDLTATAIT